jgi:hypothetical protein
MMRENSSGKAKGRLFAEPPFLFQPVLKSGVAGRQLLG